MDLAGMAPAIRSLGTYWVNSGPDGQPWDASRPWRRGSVSDPKTWSTLDHAIEAGRSYDRDCAVAIDDGHELSVLDLDGCRERSTGSISPWAWTFVQLMRSFTEVSRSGTGLHIFIRGKLRGRGGCRRGPLEVYSRRKFITVTGWHLAGTAADIQARQAELDTVVERYFPLSPLRAVKRDFGDLSDREIIERILNGEKGARLWHGDWSGYPSQSEADQALVSLLSRYTRDSERIDSLFRQSGLVRRKWEVREDYRRSTIRRAIG